MIYLKKFDTNASYEEKLNGGWGVDISLPNVSYCKEVKDVHYTPYNLVRFYVCEITEPQTVKIYTGSITSVDVTVSKGNKWYSYLLPKDKGLYKIESGIYDSDNYEWSNGIVTKVVVKSNINYNYDENNDRYNGIVPWEITEASFKGSNTSKVTNMNRMFQFCNGLTSLDLSNFNTSNVTDMGSMFNSCSGLKSLDLSNFDTSNVSNMYSMFNGCSNLISLDLSNFNTSNVTNMNSMFYNCNSLTSLTLSNFNTSKVTNMDYMFYGCSGLTSLDLSNFVTSKVTNMGYMFYGCSGLTSLDLRNFKTSKVTSMSNMFVNCSKLSFLDLSGWDMSNVISSMNSMFNGCDVLKTITMVGCSTDTVNKIKDQLARDNITGVTITT